MPRVLNVGSLNIDHVYRVDRLAGPTGHAIIQVDPRGENSIIIFHHLSRRQR